MSFLKGRYSAITATTVVFLCLVVTVLGSNIYSSFETEVTAEAVNIAGRQRMLSQRTAKALGAVLSDLQQNADYANNLSELKSASSLFDRSLNAFKIGGSTISTKGGETTLQATQELEGLTILNEAESLWLPYFASIQTLISSLDKEQSAENQATLISQANNASTQAKEKANQLLRLMNDLTNYQEGLAQQAATTSRTIQLSGIILSLLCFAAIMFLIFGQLRRADLLAAKARNETEQIFSTVDQGLFLIDTNFEMGSQHSKEMSTLFSTEEFSGRSFLKFIEGRVSSIDLDKVQRYLKLLFDPHKKQRLLGDLNPLKQLPMQVEVYGEVKTRYLSFNFSRVVEDKEINGILVSVKDITREVELDNQLQEQTRKNEQQLEMIGLLLGSNSDLFPDFLDSSNQVYEQINEELRQSGTSSRDLKHKCQKALTLIHSVKGESSALGLTNIADMCHRFEDKATALMESSDLSGDDFLPLTVMLEELINTNEQISNVQGLLASKPQADVDPTISTQAANDHNLNDQFFKLSESIATRQQKQVSLSTTGLGLLNTHEQLRYDVFSIASQFIRNAIAHGIEPPAKRLQEGKTETGNMSMSLMQEQGGDYILKFQDDGAGIDFDSLSSKARDKGLVSEEEAQTISQNQLLTLLFTHPLSTKDEADEDAGRGVGLSAVGELANKIGAKISVKTGAKLGTTFTLRIPQPTKAAVAEQIVA